MAIAKDETQNNNIAEDGVVSSAVDKTKSEKDDTKVADECKQESSIGGKRKGGGTGDLVESGKSTDDASNSAENVENEKIISEDVPATVDSIGNIDESIENLPLTNTENCIATIEKKRAGCEALNDEQPQAKKLTPEKDETVQEEVSGEATCVDEKTRGSNE